MIAFMPAVRLGFSSQFCLLLSWALIHFVWQGFLLAIAFAVVRRTLVQSSANVRYAAGLFFLLSMAACLPATLWLIDPAATDVPSVATGRGVGFAHVLSPLDGSESDPLASEATVVQPQSAIAPLDRTPGGDQSFWNRVSEWTTAALASVSTYAATAYALGLVLMLSRVFVGLSIGRRLRRCSTAVSDTATLALVRTHAERLALRAVPTIAWCSRVSVPVVVGVLRPMILLPVSLATGLTGAQLEYVLLHELAHIRRFDPLANLVERLIESLLFFHPAVWWLTRQMSVERENACDDAVLHAGCQRRAYANALLQVAELCLPAAGRAVSPAGLLAATGANPSQLARRIHRLFKADPPATVRPAAPAVAMLVLFAASVIIVMAAERSPATAESAAGLSVETLSQPNVVEIRVEGNETRATEQILNCISTRVDHPFDLAVLEKDVRTLAAKKWFLDVRPVREEVDGGLRLTFVVVERPSLRYVKYLGNTKIRDKRLAKETDLKRGASLDPDAVEEGRRRIENYYKSQGYHDSHTIILEGTKPGDRGAIYMIAEGECQKIEKTRFEGNTIARDQRLGTAIESKPPVLGLFKGEYDEEQIDRDVEKLINYYRDLGFFRARLSREIIVDAISQRRHGKIVIDEGPRYRVREIRFVGNQKFTGEQLREKLALKEGDHFMRRNLDQDLNQLQVLYREQGLRMVNVQPVLEFEEEPAKLSVVFRIVEADYLDSGVSFER